MKLRDVYATLRLVGGQEAVDRFNEDSQTWPTKRTVKEFSSVSNVVCYTFKWPSGSELYWLDVYDKTYALEQKLKNL